MTNWQELFDQNVIRAHQRRAGKLGPATFLLDRVADDLADRLGAVLCKFPVAVDLATPTDAASTSSAGDPACAPSHSSASGPPLGRTPRNSAIAVWDPHA